MLKLFNLCRILFDRLLFDCKELMQSHLVLLKLLKLIVALGLKCLFLLLKLGDRAFQILCEQLQLVLNRYVLSYVTLILL